MSDGAFSTVVRARIHARAMGRCEVCGAKIHLGGQIHHRQPRGMGGTSDESKGSCANGIWVHPTCHRKIEEQRARALSMGWLVASWDDSRIVPVKMFDGWAILTDEGGLRKVDGPG